MAREYSSVDKILQKVNLKKIQAKHLSDQCFIWFSSNQNLSILFCYEVLIFLYWVHFALKR